MENADNKVYKNRWLILLIVVMATFMSCIDSSIVNVALPVMSKELSVSMQSIEWQYTGYGNKSVLLGFIISLVSFIIFIFVEKEKEFPLVELKIFDNKLFYISIFCGFTSFVAIGTNSKLRIAGSINALVRNLGIIFGISTSTTLLYNGMSSKIGYKVINYVAGRNDVFIYGMRYVYAGAALICILGAVITGMRLKSRKSEVYKTADKQF